MPKRSITTIQKVKNRGVLALLFCAVSVVNLLILIGENTQRIFIYPFIYLYRALKIVISSIKDIVTYSSSYEELDEDTNIQEEYADPEMEVTEKKEDLEVAATYNREISQPIAQVFPTKLLAFLSNLGSFVLFLINRIGAYISTGITFFVKGLYTVFLMFFYAIIRSPLYFYHFVNEVFYFVYTFLKGVVKAIITFYTYLTGPYFRSFLYGFAFCLIAVISYHGYQFVTALPSPASIGKINFAKSTHIYDRNEKLLYEIYRDVNRTPIKITELPPYAVQATIAIEDKNFYSHKGISFFGGILRAVKDTILTNDLQGGSTITQQLVKSALLSPERTIERKLKEMVLAMWTEQMYTKDQIMEMYLNQVPYGGSSYGIEEASQVYFGKSAKYLTLSESALLAGLPQAPSLYSPFINPEAAKRRRNDVLLRMEEQGYISRQDRDSALLSKVEVLPPKTSIKAPHFVFYTRAAMEEEFGSKLVEEGGFDVTTTLDLDIQTKAEDILKEELDKIKGLNVTNGGILILKPQTGEILAMVGSVDYFNDQDGAFNVTTALRQPGSTLKPMLYAMALERGFTAASTIDDSPIIFQNPGGEPYRPVNYDNSFHGRVTLRYALSNSYNVPAVKVLNMMGVQQFVDYAKNMGIDTWNDSSRFGLSLGLGGGEVTLVDLAQIYNVFATGGYRIEPTPFKTIVDDKERVLLSSANNPKVKVLDSGIAYIISDILSDNIARQQAFGPHSALEINGHKVAVKTGTTNDKKDNLTVGYTPEFLVAVWVGNNDNSPMNPTLTSGITGAAPIWNRLMTYLLEEKSEGVDFKIPANVVAKPCYGANRNEYFLTGTEVQGYCFDTKIKPQTEVQKTEAKNVVQ